MKELDPRIEAEVASREDAQRLMTPPGVGPIYPSGSRSGSRQVGPQRRTASPKPPPPIPKGFLTSLGKIQAQTVALNGLRSRGAISCHDIEGRGVKNQAQSKSLRETAPTGRGASPGNFFRNALDLRYLKEYKLAWALPNTNTVKLGNRPTARYPERRKLILSTRLPTLSRI